MSIGGLALQGVQQAESRVEVAALRVAQGAGGGGGDVVDLSVEMLALMEAKNYSAAMVSVVKLANEMDSHILDLLA
jgi:hypothetical protein